jgi:hypothetical protein
MGETKRLGKIAVREGLIWETYLKFWGKISVDIIYLVLETSAQHLIGFILLWKHVKTGRTLIEQIKKERMQYDKSPSLTRIRILMALVRRVLLFNGGGRID